MAAATDARVSRTVIIGGGPIGLLCALLLARRGVGSTLVDARPLEQAQRDARLLALSLGSLQVLRPVFGDAGPPQAPIREVLVSSAGDFGTTRITSADFDGADLGATVVYGDLLAALSAAVAREPLIDVLRPMAASTLRQRPDAVEVTLADGSVRRAELAIRAEGADAAASPRDATTSRAWAVLADVRLLPARGDLPPGAAFERFTRDGPLALLPTPRPLGGGVGRAFSLVWCMDESQAQRRAQFDDRQALDALQAQLGPRIGTMCAIGPRRMVALAQSVRDQVHHHRVVELGNAAQTLHPVAGQGFNLGVRDCATLADELAQDADAATALARYARRRRLDRATIAALTEAMPTVFATRFAPLAVARGLGLAALDLSPLLRREFAHLLMFGVRR